MHTDSSHTHTLYKSLRRYTCIPIHVCGLLHGNDVLAINHRNSHIQSLSRGAAYLTDFTFKRLVQTHAYHSRVDTEVLPYSSLHYLHSTVYRPWQDCIMLHCLACVWVLLHCGHLVVQPKPCNLTVANLECWVSSGAHCYVFMWHIGSFSVENTRRQSKKV